MKPISKFKLYELSVQSPKWQVDYLPQFHEWLVGTRPRDMREDFCGSAKIACEWVKRSPKNRAVGIDIDPETLSYAKDVNLKELTLSQQKRVTLLKQNVLKPSTQKFDFIGAYNFSYFVFHTRKEMLKYARSSFKSLKSRGTLFLEIAGGEGFLETGKSEKKFKVPGLGTVTQVWEQHQYDPITHVNDYSIHFKLPNRQWIQDAFHYHWRIWTIRELREILEEAGFKKTVVLWEKDYHSGRESNEYLPTEEATHAQQFIAYVVGVKK